MKNNPYDVLKEVAKESYYRDRKSLDFFFSHSDKLITWLIGFAVGGITLIVANFKTLKDIIPNNIRLIIIFLSLTIIFGLIYRLAAYFYLAKNKKLENYFSGYFGNIDMTPVVAEDISNATINEMLQHIQFDFEKSPADFNPNGQELILQSLKNYYLSLVEYSRKNIEIGINSLAETYETAYKIKKEVTIDLFRVAFGLEQGKSKKISIGFNAKKWSLAVSFLFTASIISFLLCIITICILFVFANNF
ncbi:MAG TPA: hypothetical protein VIJ75_21235 [Hanamia sp.]